MISQSRLNPLRKDELGSYGLARVRDAAFDAVLKLWRRREAEGLTQKALADKIGRDPATVSKYFRGPGNWTFKTLGELVQGLNGDVEIVINALEDSERNRPNYDAYAELNEYQKIFDVVYTLSYSPTESTALTEHWTPVQVTSKDQENVVLLSF